MRCLQKGQDGLGLWRFWVTHLHNVQREPHRNAPIAMLSLQEGQGRLWNLGSKETGMLWMPKGLRRNAHGGKTQKKWGRPPEPLGKTPKKCEEKPKLECGEPLWDLVWLVLWFLNFEAFLKKMMLAAKVRSSLRSGIISCKDGLVRKEYWSSPLISEAVKMNGSPRSWISVVVAKTRQHNLTTKDHVHWKQDGTLALKKSAGAIGG